MRRRAGPWNALLFVAAAALAQTAADESLKQAGALRQAGDSAGAQRLLEHTIELAAGEKNVRVEAEARYSLAAILQTAAQYDASNTQARAALALFQKLEDRTRIANTYVMLGAVARNLGRTEESRTDFEKAMQLYQDLQDWGAAAAQHYNLAFVTAGAESGAHLERGLQLARQAGDRRIEGMLLHLQADWEYASDNFEAAFEHLNQARSLLEEAGGGAALADVLTSIGRLYRVHGHPDQALLYYRRAFDLQKAAGARRGMIQSLNATGIVLNQLGRSEEALRGDREALDLARQSGSSLLIKFILEAIASTQTHMGQYAQAAASLEEARQMPPPRMATLQQLSLARFHLGQYDAAWKAAEEALAIGGESDEVKRDCIQLRALALWKLGRTPEALRDVRQLTRAVEEARARLVPTDFMKQGFAETNLNTAGISIHVLLDGGEDREALATAERARSRAFLDLLATKRISPGPNLEPEPGRSDVLSSRAVAASASVEDTMAQAHRLNSTVLAYWVDDVSTIVWTVSPDGRIAHAQTGWGRSALEGWIGRAVGSSPDSGAGKRLEVASRSGEPLLAGSGAKDAWRQLYDALIRPVRERLPSKPGSRLTIIPSGPLFRLSFSALMDEKGRYLIENYALNYAPAIETLEYTRLARQRAAGSPEKYLLVANPAAMPSWNGKPLAALPGSEIEVGSISRMLKPGAAVLLQGKRADETSVRRAMPQAKVIHLATHGIVVDANPMDSFLALGKTGDEAEANGRLTAEEVYSLDLRADLVVLSACRTGLGRISGDGVAGLARAFFYAGAASVVSTLWDVADGPAAQLIADFYRSLGKAGGTGKSEALREAQLRLLRSLRSGALRVDTPFGKLPLPEDPVLWAGYILLGEP